MSSPDFVICLDCESPIYTFEWNGAKVTEALCTACGNDQPDLFASEEEYEEMSSMDERSRGPSEG